MPDCSIGEDRRGRCTPPLLFMPRKSTTEKARDDAAQGKSPSTQAGEFVREEIEHVRRGKHGAKNSKQLIAIGLSKARRAGVALPPPQAERSASGTRPKAERDLEKGQNKEPSSGRRSRATSRALKRSGRGAASKRALSRQAKDAASRRKRTASKRQST